MNSVGLMVRLALLSVFCVLVGGVLGVKQERSLGFAQNKELLEQLRGTWVGVSGVRFGQKINARTTRLVFEGKQVMMIIDDLEIKEANNFILDASKKPMHIDFIRDKIRIRGILTLQGDRLTLCTETGKGERPTEFSSEKGTTRMLSVYEREKVTEKK